MTPTTKSTVVTVSALVSIVMVPVLLVVFRDWIMVFIIAIVYAVLLYLFCTEMYQEIRRNLLIGLEEDQRVIDGFHGDPLKIHFYRGFIKHFRGDLTLEQLQHWLEHHRPPY